MVLASTIDFTLPLADPVLKFLLILLIILAAPLLLNKLRIPHLLGLIIAGAIIGPHGFNLVLRDSSIILSGTAGLLYIMFLAGLEIDMADFKRNSTKSLAFGMYTFLIPMILGTVVAELDADKISLELKDEGPGIPDISLAMREGYSTASEAVREMGFGAGMGLPNMKKNVDELTIESQVDVGTTVRMVTWFNKEGA